MSDRGLDFTLLGKGAVQEEWDRFQQRRRRLRTKCLKVDLDVGVGGEVVV